MFVYCLKQLASCKLLVGGVERSEKYQLKKVISNNHFQIQPTHAYCKGKLFKIFRLVTGKTAPISYITF